LRNVCLLNIAPDLTDLERYPVTQIATSKTTVGKKCDQWFRKFTASDYDGLEFKTDTEMIGAIGSDPECRQFAGLQDQCRSVTDNDGLSPEAYLNRLEATKGCLAIVGFKTVCKALEKVAKSGILLSESRRSVMSECFVTELLERRIEFLRPLIWLTVMQNIGLGLLETLVLIGLSTVIACFFAAIGGLIRYTTRPAGSTVSVYWLVKLGIFAGIPFSIIGATSGYLAGLSRVGAISALVPAGLTLVGGVAVYLFGKGGKSAVLAGFAVINLSVMMMVGALIGGRERVQTEEAHNSLDFKMRQIKEEFVLQRFRRGLGLEPGRYEKSNRNGEMSPND
jgi:hypothetical protein